MIVLNWIFTNGHRWHKKFETTEAAEAYAHQCGLITGLHVERVWINTTETEIWIKEKP